MNWNNLFERFTSGYFKISFLVINQRSICIKTCDISISSNISLSSHIQQVNIDGITGPVKFDDDGKRTAVELEILNLRNNSFVKVSYSSI